MKIFVVGDSTLASFNDQYYYPRYGYATMLHHYFNEDVKIINNALSGRSSKSYILDKEYKDTFDNLKKGDYLLIGFGHNDEKEDDFLRFSDARLPLSDERSFKYSIYHNYVEPALKIGATPIISTPVVRIDPKDIYEGNIIHDTKNGDYANALIELGKELNITVIDLTTPTKELYKKIKYNNAIYHHAMTAGIKINNEVVADPNSVDKTHLNCYGAKYVAYYFVEGLLNTNLEFKDYLIKDIKEPTIENDLYVNPNYVYKEYIKPDLNKYIPNDNFKINSKDIYGTAFGQFNDSSDLYAYESNNKFIVGTKGENGRVVASSDAYCFVFKEVDANLNFKMTADAKIIKFKGTRQSAFGLQLRDDIYINSTYKDTIASNYVCAGLITSDASTNIIYSRKATTEIDKEPNTLNEFYKENEEAHFELERIGQRISIKVIFRNKEYIKHFYDFDLTRIDNKYMYIGLCASKALIEYNNIYFEITGTAKAA